MNFFLDENFPLQLQEDLQELGYNCEHVISEGKRGITDLKIVEYISNNNYIFFTNDDDFCNLISDTYIVLFLSRVPQELLIEERVRRWLNAVDDYFDNYSDDDYQIFVISSEGKLIPEQMNDF